jgi:hypothetical protein
VNARHEAATLNRDQLVVQLRVDICRELGTLATNWVHLERLVGSRQSVGLGFLTAEARELLDRQTREDRAAMRSNPDRAIAGTDWMNRLANLGTGQVQAAVTVPAVSLAAEVLFALQHHVRRLALPAARAAAAVIPGGRGRLPVGLPVTDAPTPQLIEQLADLVEVWTNRPGLQDLLRELEHLNRKVLDVVDGPARTNHPEPCPWCGRSSLVVHHARREAGRDATFIRCEGTHRCECTYEFFECHRNHVRNRHEWINSGRAAHTLTELNNLQAARRETALMETRALDALTLAIELHQPLWSEPDGTVSDLFVHLPAAATPASHECPAGSPLDDDAAIDAAMPADRPWKPFCYVAGDQVMHAVPVCASCGDPFSGNDGSAVIWPCDTHQALDLDHARQENH